MNKQYDLLIVDDDPTVIVVLGTMLRPLGSVRFAKRAAQGLRLARQTVPDLVLLDLNLPDASGLEVLSEMRRSPELAAVPVLLLSGSPPDDEAEAWCRRPGVAFQPKPPHTARLLACVRMLLCGGGP